MNNMKMWTRAENGKLSKVLERADGGQIRIPIHKNGAIRWFDDRQLIKKKGVRNDQ